MAAFVAVSALAQPDSPESAAPPSATGGREASFLPPPSFDDTAQPPATPVPVTAVAAPTAPTQPIAPAAPTIITPPVASPIAVAPAIPAASAPASTTPSAIPAPVYAPVAAAPAAAPVDLGQPVQSGHLSDIDPESIGLFSANEGGLGAAMWKGTPRDLVERLLPSLALPTASPVLNNLAQRFLLTVADVPFGKSSVAASLTSMRVNALISLGDTKDAWKLASVAKPEQIDDDTLHRAVEFMLVGSESAKVCAGLPDIMKQHPKADWQELLIVCQLIAKDTKGAQLSLDLMHSQDVRDDTFFFLTERNVIAGNKELPRQLTPLKPVTLALLQLTGLPLRSEVYAHPDAALIPAMLQMPAKDDLVRLTFAEKSGERGIISAQDLEAVYASIVFTPEVIASAVNSTETGSRFHALLYQAAMQEKDAAKRTALCVKFVSGTGAAGLNGVESHILADMIGTVHPDESYNRISDSVARIYIMANNPQLALEWLKQARHAGIGMLDVAIGLHNLWPLSVLTGTETDSEYGQNLGKWLDTALKSPDAKDDGRTQRERAGSILLLLDAAGYAVPEEDWTKVLGAPTAERHIVPSAMLLERLRAAGTADRRGETVLLSLLLSGGNVEESSFISTLAMVRALRLSGLTADAAMLAREAAALILNPPSGKP